jgi:replicative DNA helicase
MQTLADNDKVYLCEGVFDAMRLTQEGYNAVAILGVTDFTEEKVSLFKRFNVVLALDNDEAGREMTQAIAKLFYLTGKTVRIKQLPEGIKDITDYFLQHDKARFEALPETTQEIEGLPKTATEDLPEYYKTLGDGSKNLIGIETGITALDRATMGLSGVVVLGGIAGQGKTSLALQIAYEACVLGTPVIFYSLEMPKRAIYTKILNRLSSVSYADILLKGRPYLDPEAHDSNLMGERVDFHNLFTQDEREALDEAREKLVAIGNRLYVRSRERGEQPINFTSLEAEINLVKVQHNAERVLVVVDHLQVFDFRKDEKERATDQIDKESKLIDRFKETSEKTATPILLISQKNKQGFNSSGLESIKGSVDIVYLADVVMFLESEGEKDESIFSNGYRVTKLVISKNRYNSPKTLTFTFNGRNSNFEAQTE